MRSAVSMMVLCLCACMGDVEGLSGDEPKVMETAAAPAPEPVKGVSITTTLVKSSGKELLRFSVAGRDAAISGGSIALELPWGTALAGLAPVIEVSEAASVSPASGVVRDFSAGPVTYTVTAQDGSTRTYQARLTAKEDAIDLGSVAVFNSPADVATWPITTHITRLSMRSPDVGLSFTFAAQSTWPDYTPPGWDGPLQYTVWAIVKINGQWNTSGFIQMWRGRASTGAPLLTDFAPNWAYDGRWGPMVGHAPVVGEEMGFFVTAGNARGIADVTSLRERSNVVRVSLPPGDNGTFDF